MSIRFFVGSLLFTLVPIAQSARILGIIPTPSYSHQIVYRPLWRELSLRGHQVTVCTTDPMNDVSLKNLTEIDWSFAYYLWNVKYNFSRIVQENQFFQLRDMVNEISDRELQHSGVQKLLKDPDEKFDLLMIEVTMPSMVAFRDKFKCPVIGMMSMDPPSYVHDLFGNPTHPLLYKDNLFPMKGETLSFFEKVARVLLHLLAQMVLSWSDQKENLLVQKHFGDYPPLKEMRKNMSMLFINLNPIISEDRPLTPSTIKIGGGLHFQNPKPLPEDIKSFLDNSTEGVVYFSLGSNAKSKEIPDETKKVIMDTFAELPYKVLWKFEDEDLPGKPANVKISKWLPQQDVLRHPNIKLFITQGGLQSIEEAIYSHVPMIGMAYFGDQPMNVKKLVSRGMGLQVDKDNIEKGAFKETILEVINNPRYRNKVKELAELALDQPMTGLEKAVWWTEYVIRHKGAPHLKSPAVDMPLYQYFLLDVIGFLLAVLLISIWAAYKMIRLILRLFLKSSNIDTNKKKN